MLNQDSRSLKPQKVTTLDQSSFKAIKDVMAAVCTMLSHVLTVRKRGHMARNVQINE